ncbi:MAG TPA: ATP-binding protein [Acidimicrobiia bacterium]
MELQRQMAERPSGSGLVDERMLAESMRSVRYQSEANAIADLIDNSIEAGASAIHIVYNTDGDKIVEIAVIDDGSGILPEFLPIATKWGGSSNEGRRNIFGRFGFGLPSSSVNRGRAYEVHSRTSPDHPFQAVSIDLDNLVAKDGIVHLPDVKERPLPAWVTEYVTGNDDEGRARFPNGIDGVRTVVIWRKMDRLVWPNRQQSTARLREHFGITYASWLDVVEIAVNGKKVEPVDVLFTTPGYRWYDIDGFPKAEPQSDIVFTAKDRDGREHPIRVRMSLLLVDAYEATVPPEGKGNHIRIRTRIRTDYNGIFVTRNGRFIELAKPDVIAWNPYARQVGLAIDFPPQLDELFGVTPDKQSISLSDPLLHMLEDHGVIRAFRHLTRVVADERSRRKAERDALLRDENSVRPSEVAIAKVIERDVRSRPGGDEALKEAEKNLRRKIKELAAASGVDEAEIKKAQERLHKSRPYRVEFVHELDQDPFYTPYMEGTQVVLRVNTAHPWYREVYSALEAHQAEVRSGLELLLWILAIHEIDASGEKRVFYRNERRSWSARLADAFDIHPEIFGKRTNKKQSDGDIEEWGEDDEAPELAT